MQVTQRVQSKVWVWEENHIQPITCGHIAVYPGLVPMERHRDAGRAYDARPCTPAAVDTAEILCLQFHGVSKRINSDDDL